MKTKHTPYCHAFKEWDESHTLKWSIDYGCYIKNVGMEFPSSFYLGERWLYLTPGIDTMTGGGFRGNLSDDWPCYDFKFDLNSALMWLHAAEDNPDSTRYLWTRK